MRQYVISNWIMNNFHLFLILPELFPSDIFLTKIYMNFTFLLRIGCLKSCYSVFLHCDLYFYTHLQIHILY